MPCAPAGRIEYKTASPRGTRVEAHIGRGLLRRPYRFAALDAAGADINGPRDVVQDQLLLLQVRPEDALGSPVGMAVGASGDGSFSADLTFE